MKQISPHIWSWSTFDPDRALFFNGWYVQHGDETVVIDPPKPDDNLLQFIHARGRPDSVLLTNKHHTRYSEFFRETFDCPIWIHEEDEHLMEIPVDRTFKDGDILSCGLVAIQLQNGKTRGETALWFKEDPAAMFVGDAVIGKPEGGLSMLPDEKFENPREAKLELNRLLERPFDMLLLGDGQPILEGGYEVLKTFLTQA